MAKPYIVQIKDNGIQFKIISPFITKQVHC